MTEPISPALFAVCLFVGMLICLEIGHRIGVWRPEKNPNGARTGVGVIEGAFFWFFSLLVALSLSGAASRLDSRRALILQEANDVDTAYLRVDLMPADAQPAMRDLFRKYVDSRLSSYRKLPDVDAAREELAKSVELQGQIWAQALQASRSPDSHPDTGKLLLPALNTMFDISNTRTWAALTHPPRIIYGMLFVMSLICAATAGQTLAAAKHRAWIYMLGFAFVTCLSIFVVIQIEYPRMGFIEIDRYDQALVDVRNSMK